MTAAAALLLWTLATGAVVVGAWRGMRRNIKVYLLILASCAYVSGVFVLYALILGLPL